MLFERATPKQFSLWYSLLCRFLFVSLVLFVTCSGVVADILEVCRFPSAFRRTNQNSQRLKVKNDSLRVFKFKINLFFEAKIK